MTFDRISSLAVAVLWFVLALVNASDGGSGQVYIVGVLLLLPLALIWFGDDLATSAGGAGRPHHESPVWLVKLFGWIFLLGVTAGSMYLWKVGFPSS